MPARLREKYKSEVAPALMKQFSYKSSMQVPKLEKIVINVGLGEAIQNAKLLDSVVSELRDITGQSVLVTRAKKSVATFKLRVGMPIGCMVTLRQDKMYEFFDRLVNASLPRIRDFKGVSPKSFDGRGNYSLGLKEQIIFPEIDYDKVDAIHGMDITFVTTAKTDEEGRSLLKLMGVPFRS
ncbi:MAG: 50S ribosomal protein L5 [Nitrospirota bacterium]|nr:50S ribosomal protein L5 [Nitrospirota bacterium]